MALPHSLSCMFSMATILLLIGFLHIAGVQSIGVCYGRLGNNLPSATDTINLYKRNSIRGLRLFDNFTDVFEALKGSNIDVILDVPNIMLQTLTDQDGAKDWVDRYIEPYYPAVNFKYIAVGNEVAAYNSDVLHALKNIHGELSRRYNGQIKASTATSTGVLTNSFPPSSTVFNNESMGLMKPIIEFLEQNNLPLLANIYPYFARKGDPDHVPLSFALFSDSQPNSAGYRNLFDAMLDSMYAAVKNAGGSNVPIVVSESGWPSEGGGSDASHDNAETYYRNLIQHVQGMAIETYLFAMFDENGKTLQGNDQTEWHFGLFTPDQKSKYDLNFN